MSSRHIRGQFLVRNVLSPTALTGDVNDYAPVDELADNTILRLDTGASNRTITGMEGGGGLPTATERGILVQNLSTAQTITLSHQSSSSAAANRFICPGATNYVIQAGGSAWLFYDVASSRWRVVGEAAGLGAGGTISGDLTVTGNLTVQGTTTSVVNQTTTGTVGVTVQSATALTVARTGTNYALQVDTNTASSVTGLKVTAAAAAGGLALTVISSGANENLTLDAKGSGTITVAGTSTGAITLSRATGITGALTVTSTSSAAEVVGANGATNPAWQVDASAASVATGVKVTGAAAGSRAALAVLSSGANEGLDIDAKGSGTIRLGNTSTGDVAVQRNATVAGTVTVTSNSASALIVGPNGATNPVLKVNASAASAATGIQITSAAAGANVVLAAISSGTDEHLYLDAKGAGLVYVNWNGTGGVVLQSGTSGITLRGGGGGSVTLDNMGFPVVIGGTDTSSTLTLKSTSGVGATDAIVFQVGNNGATEAGRILTTGVHVFGAGEAGTPAAQTLRGPDASGTNVAAAATTFRAGLGTGTGNAGTLTIQAAVSKQATGTTAQTASTILTVGHSQSAHPGTTGALLNAPAVTFNDENTAGSGTAANWAGYGFQAPTLSARNTSVTTTTADTVLIAGAPSAGTNMTITTPHALRVAAGNVLFSGLIKAGSTPTTLTDAAGKILSAALNTVGVAQGGTGLTSGTSGGILGFTASGTLASSVALTANALVLGGGAGATPTPMGSLGTTTTVLHGNAAGAPTFAAVSLTADVSGILPGANGGTNNGFMDFTGPATSLKTFTLPNASATILTTNAAVTVAQGGTGVATFTTDGVLYGAGTGAVQATAQGGANTILTANAGAPSFSATPTIGTSVTCPTHIGGTGTGSTLTLKSTSGVGATDAIIFVVGNNGATESFRVLTSGNISITEARDIVLGTTTGTKLGAATNQKLGLYGTTPVVQGAALTAQVTTLTFTEPGTPDYAIQNLTQTTPFGFVTQDEGNSVLKAVANLQTRLAEVETRLETIGMIAAN